MPRLLDYALQHQRWGVLPEGGGTRDQPAGWLWKMACLSNIYNGLNAYMGAPNAAKWANNNPKIADMVRNARKLHREWQKAD